MEYPMPKKKALHEDFIAYVELIVEDPAYDGMPDLRGANAEIQWEAPSNRGPGQFQHSHQRRLDWWRRKAKCVGISTSSARWISRVAKSIHPTGEKPCSVCGRMMSLRYVYPTKNLTRRIHRLPYVEDDFQVDGLEPITTLIRQLVQEYGRVVLDDLPGVFRAKGVTPPESTTLDLEEWIEWIEDTLVPAEPSVLSPGAMSNAPDRLDGFHTYNRCCRSREDSGRHDANMRTYGTDRRVFEHWNGGDWIAANALMALVGTELSDEPCRNGHDGPCSADHVGPLSLGFAHRPQFQLLCKSCNSSKNNRMTLGDVQQLIASEEQGETVATWYSSAAWDARKHSVEDTETAQRLSKILRDNRHAAIWVLCQILSAERYTYLLTLLYLDCADWEVEFIDLSSEDHLTVYSDLWHRKRTSRLVAVQKARRCRIALQSLADYEKANRNTFIPAHEETASEVEAALRVLDGTPSDLLALDGRIADALGSDSPQEEFVQLVPQFAYLSSPPQVYDEATEHLGLAMAAVARALDSMWSSDRYTREESF
jgi:Alw26I/Eco31I/Esp3I family type II restriction endonuclease